MTTYKLYPKAESDLEIIWQYTVHQWGLNRAHSYIDDLESTFQLLAASPHLSREHTEFNPPVRIHPHAHHLIIYLQKDYGIDVVRILHENMDIPARIDNLTE